MGRGAMGAALFIFRAGLYCPLGGFQYLAGAKASLGTIW
ncbi:MAG: hypothetical protein OJF48_003979 [Afipia sp.]|nr:MAG: hypothetical protein OJF48_003979 [Afipia sp.]